jgi:hypothetical protein
MKDIKNKNIDNIFKHGLEDPVDEIGYREHDWDAFEQMLDKGKKPAKIVYWLPVISSVAAVLLLALGWWLFKPQVTDQQKPEQQLTAAHPHAAQPTIAQQPATTNPAEKNNTTQPAIQPTITYKPKRVQPENTQPQYVAGNNTAVKKQTITGKPPVDVSENNAFKQDLANNQIGSKPIDDSRAYPTLAGANQVGIAPAKIETAPVLVAVDLPQVPVYSATDADAPGKVSAKKSGPSLRPQFALSVIAASELNGMNTLQQSNTGGTFGMLFSVGIKKLTISTGATYSIKPYAVGFDSYHTAYKFKTQPETITADCRLLDIPINIDYQVYNKRRNKISIGTGISSYLMMHESYDYDYADPAAIGPDYYNVKSPGKYMFSILNLQATYQRQINSKFGLSVQPYLKLPLANIGYSQIKLQTVGVAVGVNWNINSLSKPK